MDVNAPETKEKIPPKIRKRWMHCESDILREVNGMSPGSPAGSTTSLGSIGPVTPIDVGLSAKSCVEEDQGRGVDSDESNDMPPLPLPLSSQLPPILTGGGQRYVSQPPPEITWSPSRRICDDTGETAQPARGGEGACTVPTHPTAAAAPTITPRSAQEFHTKALNNSTTTQNALTLCPYDTRAYNCRYGLPCLTTTAHNRPICRRHDMVPHLSNHQVEEMPPRGPLEREDLVITANMKGFEIDANSIMKEDHNAREQVRKDTNVKTEDIDKMSIIPFIQLSGFKRVQVVLVGGSFCICRKEPSKGINPDEVVAAVQGGILSGAEGTADVVLIDVCPLIPHIVDVLRTRRVTKSNWQMPLKYSGCPNSRLPK
ncbi:hypothetical protein BD779DRAFT_1790444 [Infundibulicybe gibba]|nr:hypothetical protein BD779DRAFT_1790444 [Infundibulicybe gibba]